MTFLYKICFFFSSYIVVTIYCLGFIYSLPRFFEYKAEKRSEKLAVSDNDTEYFTHVVIKNKLHNSTIYQYTVHLSKKEFLNLFGITVNVSF
jgi:hypothetical protein